MLPPFVFEQLRSSLELNACLRVYNASEIARYVPGEIHAPHNCLRSHMPVASASGETDCPVREDLSFNLSGGVDHHHDAVAKAVVAFGTDSRLVQRTGQLSNVRCLS